MAVSQPTHRGLPSKSPLGSYVYALQFNTGLVKIGFTSSPSQRIRTYVTYLLPFEISIADRWISGPHGQAEDNEALLLDFCRSRATEVVIREYFRGLDFAALKAFAETLPYVSIPVSPSSPEPETLLTPWRQVAAAVRQRISDGTYPARSRIPSVIQLTEQFGIAGVTAQKVHRQLRAEGLIYTEPGLGSFVAEKPES